MARYSDAKTPALVLDAVPALVLPALARWTAEHSAAFTDEGSPFSCRFIEGDARVLLVTGANASGKSLAFRLIAQLAGSNDIEALTLSIRERSGSGTFEMSRMRQSMIYGNEQTSSTGATSARVVQSGFHNLTNRGPALLALDEPELGLSDGYAEALGEYIGQSAAGMTESSCGVMVVTHSRRLAEGVVRGLNATPAMLSMEAEIDSVEAWIASRETRSVDELLGLKALSHERFLAINKLLGQ